MSFEIRYAEPDDAAEIHAILQQPHVIEGTMRLPYRPLQETRERIAGGRGVFRLVAVSEERVVGFCELITNPDTPRHSHVGEINIIVSAADRQGKGVGRAMMQAMVELADTLLQLKRLELTVWTNNERALRLYESFGFAIEGTMPAYAVGADGYIDAHKMGRVRI